MMNDIGRGTTPTLSFDYVKIKVNTISVAFLTMVQGKTTIEKTLGDAIIDTENNSLIWKLTQNETLQFVSDANIKIQVRYKLVDGTAGKSPMYSVPASVVLKDGVI